MNEDKAITISDPGPLKDNGKLNAVLLVMAGLGVVFFLAGMLLDPRRTWYNFIIDYFFFMALGVAGLVLAAVHYAAGATWSVTVRRVAEGMSAWLPVSLVLSLLLILAIPALYAWDLPEHIHLWHEKHIYLCKKCFMLRQFLSYAIWIWLGMAIVRNSLKQDSTGDTNLYWRNKRLSVIFLLLFALTITFMSVDLLMSLEETWYSTMFPVYIFAGLFLSGYAACVILVIVFRRAGYLAEAVQDYHLRDMGTWLMAFSVFMVYIGFSQYMLIWYANLPLEIGYMIKRSHGGWGYIFVLLPAQRKRAAGGLRRCADRSVARSLLDRGAGLFRHVHLVRLDRSRRADGFCRPVRPGPAAVLPPPFAGCPPRPAPGRMHEGQILACLNL